MQGLPCAAAFVRGILGFRDFFFNEKYKYISSLLADTRESKANCHVYSSVEFFLFSVRRRENWSSVGSGIP